MPDKTSNFDDERERSQNLLWNDNLIFLFLEQNWTNGEYNFVDISGWNGE